MSLSSIRTSRRSPGLAHRRHPSLRPAVEALEERTVPTIFTVTSTLDNGDDTNPIAGSLRKAIIEANNHPNAGLIRDLIQFNIAGTGVHTIRPPNTLPGITDPVVIDGYTQSGASANTLATGDNAVLTIELSGSAALAGTNGLVIKGGFTTVRGLVINGFRADNNGFGGQGAFLVNLAGNPNNTLTGNFIGTNAAGTDAVPNTLGILVFDAATATTIGGTTPAARNLISGNAGIGIDLASDGNVVQGNYIGTDVTGAAALGNRFSGVVVNGSNNRLGGTSPAEGNVIAFNLGSGVGVGAAVIPPVGNSILGNSLFSNAGLGIDLNFDAVTANDSGDADGGPNHLQNFPVLLSARSSGSGTLISGTLNSTPDTRFRIELFSSRGGDLTGFGEGDALLGDLTVVTNSDGNANFSFQTSDAIPLGRLVSATATNQTTGDTSEFSQNVQVDFPGRLQFSAPTFGVGENDGSAAVTVVRTGGSHGIVSVRVATTGGSATAGADFADASQTLIFADGVTNKTFTIPIHPDNLVEGNESVNLTLSNPTGGATLGAADTAVLTILDVPPPPAALARPITARLFVKTIRNVRKLFVRVTFADTGAPKAELRSPFQKPLFRRIVASVLDSDGDGVADAVLLTARKGKKSVRRTFPA